MLQVNHKYDDEQTGVESYNPQLRGQAAMVVKESKHATSGKLYPEKAPGDGSVTIATATMKPSIAEYGDEVFGCQAVVASLTMRWWS